MGGFLLKLLSAANRKAGTLSCQFKQYVLGDGIGEENILQLLPLQSQEPSLMPLT